MVANFSDLMDYRLVTVTLESISKPSSTLPEEDFNLRKFLKGPQRNPEKPPQREMILTYWRKAIWKDCAVVDIPASIFPDDLNTLDGFKK